MSGSFGTSDFYYLKNKKSCGLAGFCLTFYSFPFPSGWISRTSVNTLQTWWCADWWRGLCCGRDLAGEKWAATGSGFYLPPPMEHLHPLCSRVTLHWLWVRAATGLEGPSSVGTERRIDSVRVNRKEGKEEEASLMWTKWQQKRVVGRWMEYGRWSWIRGAGVVDVSITGTPSCTIHR